MQIGQVTWSPDFKSEPRPSHLEVDTCRSHLAPYCVGTGLDLGFGGIPIVPTAITIDTNPDTHPNIHGDAATLPWFRDNSMDYVFSSHLLEDFHDTIAVLRQWSRVLVSGGNLVLFLPDQPTYEAHCKKHGTVPNPSHKHALFGPEYAQYCLPDDCKVTELVWPFPGNAYSFSLVASKL